MIVVLKHGAEPDKREQLIGWLKNQGLGVHVSEGAYQTVLGLIGDTARVDMDLIESLSIVDSVKRVTEPFKCCNRKFHPDDMIVQVGDVKVGGGNFCMIAGPCSVESEEQIVAVAKMRLIYNIDIRKCPGCDKVHLGADSFLCGCADEYDAARKP